MDAADLNRVDILAVGMPQGTRNLPEFAGRLARLRKSRRLTQAQLAKAVGVSQGLISFYERSTKEPVASIVARLAQALGVSTDDLLGVKPGKPINDMDRETLRLWRRFQKLRMLSYRDQRAVVRHMQSLVKTKTPRETSTAPPSQ